MSRWRACRTEELGGRILRCSECGTQVVEYNRCNTRGCPRCAPERQAEWRRDMADRVLPIPHFHLVFAGPAYLVDLWHCAPRRTVSALFASAAASVKRVASQAQLTVGFTLAFHSHGVGLSFKPHIHCMLTPGGVDATGTWTDYRGYAEDELRSRFRSAMLRRLRRFAPPRLASRLAEDREKDWRVDLTYHADGPTQIITYLSRTLFGSLLDTRFHQVADDTSVTLTEYHAGTPRITTLSRQLFIHRYFAHIPPSGLVTVRHYGLYSNHYSQVRAAMRTTLAIAATASDDESVPPGLQCPRCRARMVVDSIFLPTEIPPRLTLYRRARGSPPLHRHIITFLYARESA